MQEKAKQLLQPVPRCEDHAQLNRHGRDSEQCCPSPLLEEGDTMHTSSLENARGGNSNAAGAQRAPGSASLQSQAPPQPPLLAEGRTFPAN